MHDGSGASSKEEHPLLTHADNQPEASGRETKLLQNFWLWQTMNIEGCVDGPIQY